MLIFSSFDNDKKFIEASSLHEASKVNANDYALVRVSDNNLKESLELAKDLKREKVGFVVYVDGEASFVSREVNMFLHIYRGTGVYPVQDKHGLPLNVIVLLFAQLGASFCLLDERNHSLLPLAQLLANHYLLDLKILAVVESYLEIQDLSFWCLYTCEKVIHTTKLSQIQKEEVAIDGVVEKELIVFKQPIKDESTVRDVDLHDAVMKHLFKNMRSS